MGTRILKIALKMTEIIDPKVGNPLKKEAKSAIKMVLSKSSLSHVLFCNQINFSRRKESKVSFEILVSWAIEKVSRQQYCTLVLNLEKVPPSAARCIGQLAGKMDVIVATLAICCLVVTFFVEQIIWSPASGHRVSGHVMLDTHRVRYLDTCHVMNINTDTEEER